MDDPRTGPKTDADERRNPPEFDDPTPPEGLVAGDHTQDDFFDAVSGLDSPATVGEITDLAGHGVNTARKYLEWSERTGIVT